MNVQEVASVLAYFGAAFPTMEISDDTADLWVLELADIDPQDAQVGMREYVRTNDTIPNVAKFRTACAEAKKARERVYLDEMPALPTPPPVPPPTEVRQLAQRLRLKSMAGGHWHGGPDPCPMCGGLPPVGERRAERLPTLPKGWCSRCGEQTLPHSHTLDPVPVDAPLAYGESA